MLNLVRVGARILLALCEPSHKFYMIFPSLVVGKRGLDRVRFFTIQILFIIVAQQVPMKPSISALWHDLIMTLH